MLVLPDVFLQRGWRKLYSHVIVWRQECTLLNPLLLGTWTLHKQQLLWESPACGLCSHQTLLGHESSKQASSPCKGHLLG